jgi:group I intron endonuclease
MKHIYTSGIYIIQCLNNGACYVGQGVRLNRRIGSHRSKLNRGCHELRLLQADWNRYGRNGFAIWKHLVPMEILDKMEASTTIEMNALEHLGGYNLSLIRERVYSARIRDTEAKLLRKRKFLIYLM